MTEEQLAYLLFHEFFDTEVKEKGIKDAWENVTQLRKAFLRIARKAESLFSPRWEIIGPEHRRGNAVLLLWTYYPPTGEQHVEIGRFTNGWRNLFGGVFYSDPDRAMEIIVVDP